MLDLTKHITFYEVHKSQAGSFLYYHRLFTKIEIIFIVPFDA